MSFGRRLVALLGFLLLWTAPAHATAADTTSFLGTWMGTIDAGGASFRVVFTVQQAGPRLSGRMDSPDQGVTDIPVPHILVSADTLRMGVPSIAGQFAGVLDAASDQIQGRWVQGDLSLPLTLARTDTPPAVQRPQEPLPPFPYVTESLRFATDTPSVTLEGTLSRPPGDDPVPAVVLVGGMGPQDRDGTRHGHKPFLVLADHLTRAGIAVFRFDERGVGASGGTQRGRTFADFARDVRAAVDRLKRHPGIDTEHIGLIGHAEGGVIASLTAQASGAVRFLALLSSPGLPGDEILADQLDQRAREQGLDRRTRALQRGTQQRMFEALLQEADSASIADDLRRIMIDANGIEQETVIQREVDRLMQPWLRFYLAHAPAKTLQQTDVPVLALYGANDRRIDVPAHRDAVEQAFADNPDRLTIQTLDGLNHRLQPSPSGSPADYGRIPETIAPDVLDLLSRWIRPQTN